MAKKTRAKPSRSKARAPSGPPAGHVELTCRTCGVIFHEPKSPGRYSQFCEKHRPKTREASQRSQVAHHHRKRLTKEVEAASRNAYSTGRISRLAAGLRLYREAEHAASAFGVLGEDDEPIAGEELAELEGLARSMFPEVIGGTMKQSATLAEAVLHASIQELAERLRELSGKDLIQAIRTLGAVREDLRGQGSDLNYTKIELSITPPPGDGKLPDEDRRKVQGES